MVGVEPDGDAPLGDAPTRARIEKGPAAGRQHHRPIVEQAKHHAALAVAEIALAIFRENLRNRHARGGDDLGVGVDEFEAKPRRQPLTYGALAGAHHADKHDAMVL